MAEVATVSAAVLPLLTERDWQKQVVNLARTLGYKVYHTRYSIGSDAGWPDLALVKPGRLVFVELKSERGKVTPAQTEWLAALNDTPAEAYVWRPSQWDLAVSVLSGNGNAPGEAEGVRRGLRWGQS